MNNLIDPNAWTSTKSGTDFINPQSKIEAESGSEKLSIEYLFYQVENLKNELEQLKKQDLIISSRTKEISIRSLGDTRIGLKYKIPILIESYDEETIATFIDAEVVGFGDTEPEAIENLKKNLVDLYFELIEDENNLGPIPQNWLLVLREICIEK